MPRSWNTATAEGYDCTRPRRFGPSGDGGKVDEPSLSHPLPRPPLGRARHRHALGRENHSDGVERGGETAGPASHRILRAVINKP